VHTDDVFVRLTPTWGPSFTLAADAEPGEYRATFRWDTGPYQGVVEVIATFDIVTN